MRLDQEISEGLQWCRRGLWTAGIFSLALNLLMLTVPIYMMQVYDRVFASQSEETLLMLTIIAVGALAIVGVLEALRQIILCRTSTRIEAVLGERLLMLSHESAEAGSADTAPLRDLAHVRQFISSPLVSALFDAPTAPLYLALIYIVHPQLGWIALGAALLLVLVSIVNQRLARVPIGEASRHGAEALQKVQVQLRNAEVIRAMGMRASAIEAWGEDNARGMIAAERATSRNAALIGLTRFLRFLLQIAILGYGAWLVLSDNNLNAGVVFAASMIAARALAPLDQAIGGWGSLASALQSWRRLKELIAAIPAKAEPMPLPAPSGRLSAESIVYTPAGGAEPVIKGISFAIEPGEILGVLGPSGAGKSTLARMLVGALKPSAGLVRIGGDDLAHWSSDALGPYIGYLPQDVELFPATIAENIARLTRSPDPNEVVAAATLANCHELIQSLPQGYNTLLGPGGHRLSGGQRQRVALARAFYGRPKVVVLDEPNASLDSDGEHALIAALIAAHRAGITCVVITQRTAVVPALTKVMVLRDGRIEAFGSREEILQRQIRPAASAGSSSSGGAREAGHSEAQQTISGTAAAEAAGSAASRHGARPQDL